MQQTNNIAPKNCQGTLDKELSPPPGLFWGWLRNRPSGRLLFTRAFSSVDTAGSEGDSAYFLVFVFSSACICVVLLLLLGLNKFLERSQLAHPRGVHVEESPWISSPVARLHSTTSITGYIRGNLRKRHALDQKPCSLHADDLDSLPADVSCVVGDITIKEQRKERPNSIQDELATYRLLQNDSPDSPLLSPDDATIGYSDIECPGEPVVEIDEDWSEVTYGDSTEQKEGEEHLEKTIAWLRMKERRNQKRKGRKRRLSGQQ